MLIIQKISCSNKEYPYSICQYLSRSLSNHESSSELARFVKTLHGKSLQTIWKFRQCIVMSTHGTMPIFNLFWLIFHLCYFRKRQKSIFTGFQINLFTYCAAYFFLHKASTCGQDRKRDFCNNFCTIICVLVVQIWIICIKCKENAVKHLNIANEPPKMQTCMVLIS